MRSAGIIATAVSAICSSVVVVVDAGTSQTQSPTDNISRPGGQPSTPFPTFELDVSFLFFLPRDRKETSTAGRATEAARGLIGHFRPPVSWGESYEGRGGERWRCTPSLSRWVGRLSPGSGRAAGRDSTSRNVEENKILTPPPSLSPLSLSPSSLEESDSSPAARPRASPDAGRAPSLLGHRHVDGDAPRLLRCVLFFGRLD